MNVVVTGASSFIGVPMIRELTGRGHHVYGVVRPGSKQTGRLFGDFPGLSVLEMDLGELDHIGDRILESCEWFCHFGWDGAGSGNRTKREIQQKNVLDSKKALEGAKSLGCRRFLFSGSQAEYGDGGKAEGTKEAMTEEALCHPVSEYGIAKTDFGRYAIDNVTAWNASGETEMEYIHARIFSVYGPGDHPWSLVESCIETFLRGEYISLGECSQLWNFLYIDDLIRALLDLLEAEGSGRTGYYNLAAPEGETRVLREYVRMMYEACGEHGSYSYGRRSPNAEGPADLIPDIGKLERETGWKPEISFPEGIKRVTTGRGDRKEVL